jgi:hypothetical protein
MAQGDGGFPAQQALGFAYDEGHAEQGLTALAGMPVLLQFHEERLIEQAQQRWLPGQVNSDLVRELARRGEPQKTTRSLGRCVS